jgi:integrase
VALGQEPAPAEGGVDVPAGRRGDWVNPTLTRVRVEEWAREWQATIVHLEPNTVAWYDGMLRVHVLPAFGETPVGAIDQAAVRRFVASVFASGRSSRTVKGAYQTLRHVMATAQGSGAIRVNPCDGVKPPRAVQREMLFLSAEQVIDLTAAMAAPYGTLVTFAAYSGLRAGEIGGLRVGRLDLLRGSVDVAEALKDTAGRLHFGPTKSHERRTVRLPRFLCELLGAYLAARPNGGSDWSSRRPEVRHCVTTRSTAGSSSRRWSPPGFRAHCVFTTSGTPVRPSSSLTGPTRGRSWNAWATRRSPSRSTPTATCSRRSTRPSVRGWSAPSTPLAPTAPRFLVVQMWCRSDRNEKSRSGHSP